jgi:pimeloyl-ACP methyl ester carboxylesterase
LKPHIAGLRRLAVALPAAVVVCWAAAASASASVGTYPIPLPPVVLITGLHDSHAGMSPGGNCNAIGTMSAMCSALVAAGQRVYVVSAAAGPGAVIDNAAAIDGNAQNLANFLKSTVGGPAFLVGHSMGGIIARVAISRDGAQAAGLFTIGSPEDGSFGADLAEGVTSIPCSGLICTGLEAAAKSIVSDFGTAAVADLTQSARAADNANLSPVGVPLWEYAGTACSGPDPTGYYFPNDGIVGRSSAFGATANMGPATQTQGNDFHISALQTALKLVCSPFSGTNIELTDSTVISEVLAAADCIDTATCGGGARDVVTAIKHSKRRKHKKRKTHKKVIQPRIRLHIKLLSAHPQTANPGATVAVTPTTSIVSTTPFEADCNGQEVPALPALSGQLFGVDPAVLNCTQVTITSTTSSGTTSSAPVQLAVLSDARSVTATLVGKGTNVRITVAATGRIAKVEITSRGRPVRIHARGLGGRHVTATVPRTRASNTTVAATVSGQRYAGQIPPLPTARVVVVR